MKMSATVMAAIEAMPSPSPAFRRFGSSIIGLTQAPEEQGDDDHRDDEERIGHGARIAQVEETQARAEGKERERLGRNPGAAACQREGNVEDLERFGEAEQKDDDDR